MKRRAFLTAVTTYGSPANVDLSLTALSSFPETDAVVLDDHSCDRVLANVCRRHGVALLESPARHRPFILGDLAMIRDALAYASSMGYDRLVKLSRRFVWTKDPFPGLARLFDGNPHAVLSRCDEYGFPVRTECMALSVRDWLPLTGEMSKAISSPAEGFSVEKFFGELSARLDRETGRPAAEWPELGRLRHRLDENWLWHDGRTAEDYWRMADAMGLPWSRIDFFGGNSRSQ